MPDVSATTVVDDPTTEVVGVLAEPTHSSRTTPGASARRARRGLLFAVVAVGAALMLFPFFWTIVTSIQADNLLGTPSIIPTDVTLDAYRKLFAAFPFVRALLNSAGLAIASTL